MAPVSAEVEVSQKDPDLLALEKRLNDIDERLARLELAAAQPPDAEKSDAMQVSYNPSRTTLAARTVQDAVDELALQLKHLEGGPMPLGAPGEGLFQIQGKKNQPGGPGGPPGGGKGPPPGGGPGGSQGGKGPPPGGNQQGGAPPGGKK